MGKDKYQQIKVASCTALIPFAVGIGPVAGFFLGSYLVKTFSLGNYVIFICITLGFISGLYETIRIIKFIFRETKQ